MPELIVSKSLLQAQFVVSLPLGLMSAMSLICAAPHFEGLDAWLPETRQRLPHAFLDEMALVLGFPGRFHRFVEEVYATLLAENPALSYEAFLARLRASSEEAYVEMAHHAIAKGVKSPLPPEAVRALLRNSAALPEHLRLVDLKIDVEAALAFLKDLSQLKRRFIAVVERFWRKVYEAEWAATLPLMEWSVAYHRRQRYQLNFPDLFVAVTGCPLPEAYADLTPDRVCFVPSCYLGSYLAFMNHGQGITVFYNCRATPTGGQPRDGLELLPSLKALADETRLRIVEMLRGREMYARQIADSLGISLAAASRHLELMAGARVLCVRREGNVKLYAVDASALIHLAEALARLIE